MDNLLSLEQQLQALAPPTFKVTNVIRIGEGDWEVILCDDNGAIVATGISISDALAAATERALRHEYVGRFKLSDVESSADKITDLFSKLGFKRAGPIVTRRI